MFYLKARKKLSEKLYIDDEHHILLKMSKTLDDIPESELMRCAENTMTVWSSASMADGWKSVYDLFPDFDNWNKDRKTKFFLNALILGKIEGYKSEEKDYTIYTNTCLKTNKLLSLAVCRIEDNTAKSYDFMSSFNRTNNLSKYMYKPEFCQVEYDLHVPEFYNKVEAIILKGSPFYAYFRGKKNMVLKSRKKMDGTKTLYVYDTVNPNVQYQLPSNHPYSL